MGFSNHVRRLQFGSLLLFVLFCGYTAYNGQCPGPCVCPPHSQVVYCNRKKLTYIPKGIASSTLQLNLNDNKFQNPVLNRGNFSGFPILEHLYLSGCEIKYVTVDSFSDLLKLKFLDISRNDIRTIADFTFRGLTLDHLFLNNNPGIQIAKRSFDGLRTRGLYIHSNGLVNLSLDVLRPLNGTLHSLWLDKNKFETFNLEWYYLFRGLRHLRLGDNPLHCNCEVAWLYVFYQNNVKSIFGGVEPPSCRTPSSVRGKSFGDLAYDDLKCQLPVFKHVDVVFEVNIGKLTCRAGGDPVPTLYWTRPDGSSEIYYADKDDRIQDTEGILYITDPQSIDKAKYSCIASNPAGNVSFSLNVIWPPEKKKAEVDFGDYQRKYKPKDPPKTTKSPLIDTKQADSTKTEEHKGGVFEWKDPQPQQPSRTISDVRREEPHFSLVDIVGSVIGTFLLTLLACVVTFHFYTRRQERLLYRSSCGSGSDIIKVKRNAPNTIFMTNDGDDHCGKMINHLGNSNYEDIG